MKKGDKVRFLHQDCDCGCGLKHNSIVEIFSEKNVFTGFIEVLSPNYGPVAVHPSSLEKLETTKLLDKPEQEYSLSSFRPDSWIFKGMRK